MKSSKDEESWVLGYLFSWLNQEASSVEVGQLPLRQNCAEP
jgi:hypothetical protein